MADVREGKRAVGTQEREAPSTLEETDEQALAEETGPAAQSLRRGVPTVDFQKGQPPSGPPGTAGPPTWGAVTVQPNQEASTERYTSPADRAMLALSGMSGAPQGGGGATPGGWVPKSYEVERSGAVPVDPRIAEELSAAKIYQTKGAIGQAAAQAGANLAEGEAATHTAALEAQSGEQMQRMHAGKQKVVGHYRKILEDIDKDLADDRVDGRRLWKNTSVGSKVLLAFAAGVAGVAANLSGTPGQNGVVDNILRNIDMDNREQLRVIQGKAQHGERVQNALHGLVQTFGDEQSAMLGLKSLKLSAIQQELLKRKSVAKTALERANLDKTIGDLAEEDAKTRLELDKLSTGKVGETYKQAYALPKAGPSATNKGAMPTFEEMKWIHEQYNQAGMPQLEQSLYQLGEAMGLDGGILAETAMYHPGQLPDLLARASVKDPSKLQASKAAFSTFLRSTGGKVLSESEIAFAGGGFGTATPQQRATTAKLLGDAYRRNESQLEAAVERGPETINAYQMWQLSRRNILTKGRGSFSAPAGEQVRK